MKISKGKTIAIIGEIGTGKSSLLNGLIGEMKKTSGEIKIEGSIAFCSQEPWIQSNTIKENILFGKDFEKEKYEHILKICCLETDLDLLPFGDLSQIGEKGYNLSGGQQARLSLARSLYSEAEIYLFDDILSAVDAEVSRKLFNNCIKNHLKDKTVVLVTHQLQYLPFVDYIYLFDEGKIIEQGNYKQLIEKKDGKVQETLNKYLSIDKNNENHEEKNQNKENEKEKKKDDKKSKKNDVNNDNNEKKSDKIIQDEEREKGSVSFGTYINLLKSLGLGNIYASILVLLIVFFLFFFTGVTSQFNDYWISDFLQNDNKKVFGVKDQNIFLIVYSSVGVGAIIFSVLRNLIFLSSIVVAGGYMHNVAFKKLLQSPMSFFESTPVGRITSRFSSDIFQIDQQLSMTLLDFFFRIVVIGFSILLMIISIWELIFPITFIAVLFYILQKVYRKSSRELKRIESIQRSPFFAFASESFTGLPTIKSYRQIDRFKGINSIKLDSFVRSSYYNYFSQVWFGFRLNILKASLLTFSVFIVFIIKLFKPNEDLSSSFGLALLKMFQVSALLQYLVTIITRIEQQMNSVERVGHYMFNLPSESNKISLPLKENSNDKDEGEDDVHRISDKWLKEGKIQFKNFSMSYTTDKPIILNNLNLTINPKEKIGIIGRTGSGKSSMMVSIFRLVDSVKGGIFIDNYDIFEMNIHKLRKNLSIIPQHPIIFSGTVKSNLDPFKQYSNEKIWDSLKKAHLYDYIYSLPHKLDSVVTEGGKNFSVGQRQLLCLARCLLKETKILMMDEASSSTDVKTDTLIQESIEKYFKDSTVLTIAHRLNTIINSDRILVLEKGNIKEFDTPKNLLKKDSLFSKLVKETGKENEKKLRSIVFGEEQLVI